MTLRKQLKEIDSKLHTSFEMVGEDMEVAYAAINKLERIVEKQGEVIKQLVKDQRRSTKVGPVTGRTYSTLAGRVKAIQEHLGVKFEVKPKQVIPAKIDVVKVKKAK